MPKLSDYKITIASGVSTIGFGIGTYFQPYLAIGAGLSILTAVADNFVRIRRNRAESPIVPESLTVTTPESPVISPVIHPDPNTIVNVIVETQTSRYEGNPNRKFLESLDNAATEIAAHRSQPSAQYRRDSFVTYQYSEKRLLRRSGHLTEADLEEFHNSLERIKATKESNVAIAIDSPKSGGPEV